MFILPKSILFLLDVPENVKILRSKKGNFSCLVSGWFWFLVFWVKLHQIYPMYRSQKLVFMKAMSLLPEFTLICGEIVYFGQKNPISDQISDDAKLSKSTRFSPKVWANFTPKEYILWKTDLKIWISVCHFIFYPSSSNFGWFLNVRWPKQKTVHLTMTTITKWRRPTRRKS